MKSERRKDTLEAIGLIAIVASLIFLAVETRQNTNALFAASRQAVMGAALQELFLQFENPDIALSITKDGPLTPEEHIRLDTFLTSTLRAREFAWLQYKDDIVDQAQWDTEVAVIETVFDSQRNRDWWNNLGREYFGTGFVRFIDSVFSRQPATNEMWGKAANWSTPTADKPLSDDSP
jgi:hypothetical protein